MNHPRYDEPGTPSPDRYVVMAQWKARRRKALGIVPKPMACRHGDDNGHHAMWELYARQVGGKWVFR